MTTILAFSTILLMLWAAGVIAQPAVTNPDPSGLSVILVPEDTTTGTVLDTVLPTTSGWTYTLVSTPTGVTFSINAGGSIQLDTPLDYESATGFKSYTLTITVTDPSGPTTTTSILTVQVTNVFDEVPVITGASTASVDEEATGSSIVVGYTVTDVETANGDKLSYSLLGPDAGYFNIDPNTGDITVASRIDSEAGITYLSITVRVTDRGGLSATHGITITVNDINDNEPVCSPGVVYRTVAENTVGGVNIGSISCPDPDSGANGNVALSIFSGDDFPSAKFVISGTALETTGQVLDYETRQTYQLIIHAVDQAPALLSRTGTVIYNIQVDAVNDNNPVWTANSPPGTVFSVSESSPLGHTIVTVSANDLDLGPDGVVTYSIVSITPNTGPPVTGMFNLDLVTGKMTLATKLDRESVSSYDVVVRASDGGIPTPKTDDATLKINIIDVNDNSPTFTAASVFTGTVTESNGPGTSILTLVASDLDATSTFTYAVFAGDNIPPTFEFSSTNPGRLQLARGVDLDKPVNEPSSYTLTVTVTDGGLPLLTGTTYVTVTVTPTNDHQPVLNTPVPASSVNIDENSGIRASVATVTATDSDFGVDGQVTYSISGIDFNIDPLLGVIRTTRSFDYEAGPRQYTLTVTATDGSTTSPRSSAVILTVNVNNVNDNAPTCPAYAVNILVPEGPIAPTTVTTMLCTDADPPDTLTYAITGGNTGGFFSIPVGTTTITRIKDIDYEVDKIFTLTVNVADNGATPNAVDVTVRVEVTPVNEFSPVFTPAVYAVTMAEDAAVNDNVVQVSAKDGDDGADGIVKYAITSGDKQGNFIIDQTTGIIFVAKPLDRELVQKYDLIITASDSSLTSPLTETASVTVTISDVNDNRPVFNPAYYVVNVTESSLPPALIVTVFAKDDDDATTLNADLVYSILSGDPSGTFEFNNKNLQIAAGKSLNYATAPSYDLQVQVSDKGVGPLTDTARVVINVLPANQNPPIFTAPNQNVSLLETVPIGTKVLQANATDSDSGSFGTVKYTIIDGNVPVSFIIESKTGDILVWSPLDFDTPPTFYNLTLEATDGGGLSSTTWLYIDLVDVNDNVPQFTKNIYNIAVDEDVVVNHNIGKVIATDDDTGPNGDVEYFVVSGDGQTTFRVEQTTGIIRTTAPLDFESKTVYNLVIRAEDKGTPTSNTATTLVIINVNDINDNTPIFTPAFLTVDLSEDAMIRTLVTVMTASDADSVANSNGIFALDLQSNEFKIDSTGNITTLLTLDRETTDSYVLNVTAVDQNGLGPNTGWALLTINILDINDNTPVITGTYVKFLPENTAVGSIIDTIIATDADSGRNAELTYTIDQGDPNNDFVIDRISGILQLQKPLNREHTPSYSLVVNVTDNGVSPLFSTVTVILTVTDINDNTPVFQGAPYVFSIEENVPLGSYVGKVLATDADTGANGAVDYEFVLFLRGNSSHFSIKGDDGQISANPGLDREVQDKYSIVVRASDSGIPVKHANTTITINILDTNDNSPEFASTSYSGSVLENTAPGKIILSMAYSDKDLGANAKITLSIDTTTTEGARADLFFSLDSISGSVVLKATVDRETDPTFVFKVLGTDAGLSQRSGSTTVTVTVLDVNDNAPVMAATFYNTEVVYSGICDASITTVGATDKDVGANGQVVYYLIQSTYNYLFNIDANTGVVSLQSQATPNSRYIIEATARDSGSPILTAVTSSTIRVDTFDPKTVAVTFRLNIDQAAFENQKSIFISEVEALIRVKYPTALFRVWCVEPRSGTSGLPPVGNRKRRQATSPVNVHAYTVADSSTESAANVNVDKSFLSSSETLQFLATDPFGTPSAALTRGNLAPVSIQSATPYYETSKPWAQTAEGIAILTVISLVIAALIATAIIVAIYTCRKRARPITPLRRVRRRRASMDEEILTAETKPARNAILAPVEPAKPLPMKPGDDGISSLSYNNGNFERSYVDQDSGVAYTHNSRTNERHWLTTLDGRPVKVTHH